MGKIRTKEIFKAWGHILAGRLPTLSIEVTRECPLRCPGCYAYEDAHLGGGINLRELGDYRGQELIDRVLALVERYRPMHVSIVGGDPLVRFREMEKLLPRLVEQVLSVQLVTSAFRPIPPEWAQLPRLDVAVSIDGLQPEHDARRSPATYERILKNIAGQRITIHCTITGQMMKRRGYLEEFLRFWSPCPDVKRVWMSMFTPQRGANLPECLSEAERLEAIAELLRLRELYPKLDMYRATISEFANPPKSPRECLFARTTVALSADLKTRLTPCQFGGDPDCARCGCMASMGLAAIRNHKLLGPITTGTLFEASSKVGTWVSGFRHEPQA